MSANASAVHANDHHLLMSKPEVGKGSLLDIKSREVYKPILDNPYTQGPEFPAITKDTAKAILDYLLQLLPSYGNYQSVKDKKTIEPHPLHGKITIGFNSTVQALEGQASSNRQKVFRAKKEPKPKTSIDGYMKYVFVAKNDISTPLLTSMFPLLAYSASKSLEDRVKLIELPKGSMNKLLDVLHTPNVSILGISELWIGGKELFLLIDREIVDIDVPWLQGLFDGQLEVFQEPAIRFLKTKAPVGKRPGKKERQQKKKEDREAKRELQKGEPESGKKRTAEDNGVDAKRLKQK